MHLVVALSLFLFTFPPSSSASPDLLWRRADSVVPLSPQKGDTIVAKSNFDILWTANTANTPRNVTISLRQGPVGNMSLVHIIAASTPNNGSYAWRSYDDDYLYGAYTDHPASGCNYSIEFRTGGAIFDSDYFTILNERDGGITGNMTSECGNRRPLPCGGKGKKNSGVSLGALIGGVVGTAAGTSLLLGFLFLVALKKDWIVTKKECRRRSDERGMMGEAGQPLHKYSGHDPNLQQIGGDPVYQLPS